MVSRALQPTDFKHWRFLTFSVGRSMWDACYAYWPTVGIDAATRECLWYSGASIDIIADPNSHFWTSRDMGGGFLVPSDPGGTGGLINGISDSQDPTIGTNLIDCVVLNVSGMAAQGADPVLSGYNGGTRPNLGITSHDTTGYPSFGYCFSVGDWKAYTAAAIANIRSKYPNVRLIYLQPNLGGPGRAVCPDNGSLSGTNAESQANGIRCTFSSPKVISALATLCTGNVRMGWLGQAGACADFSDWAGHLNTTPRTTLGQAMATHYANPANL
jgi:hypothetical protein